MLLSTPSVKKGRRFPGGPFFGVVDPWGPALADAPTFGHLETGGTKGSILHIRHFGLPQELSIPCIHDCWGTG